MLQSPGVRSLSKAWGLCRAWSPRHSPGLFAGPWPPGCSQAHGSPVVRWPVAPGSLPLPFSSPLSAVLFFSPYYTFQTPSGLEMISSPRQGVSHKSASSLHGRRGDWGALGPLPQGWGPPQAPWGQGAGAGGVRVCCRCLRGFPGRARAVPLSARPCWGCSAGRMASPAPRCCSAVQMAPVEPSKAQFSSSLGAGSTDWLSPVACNAHRS